MKKTPIALALALSFCSPLAFANDMFTVSGFGTLGVVGSNTDDAEYVIPGQTHGGRKRLSGEVDSKVAVQLGAKFNPMFSATAQVMSRQNGEGNFRPKLEWAFLKGQLTPEFSVRLGRMGAPLFAVSDFRNVGYANLWLRPPTDVYGQVSFSSFDGLDASYQTAIGGSTLTVQAFGGSAEDVFANVDLEVKKLGGLNASLDFGNGLTMRLGHAQGKLTVKNAQLNQLVNVLRTTPFAAVGDQLDPTDTDASFSGLGLSYDDGGAWVAHAEYTKRKTDSVVPDTTGWFVTGGYRIGKFTPYVTLSEVKSDNANVNNTIPAAAPGNLRALVAGAMESQRSEQKTTAVGLRWDAYRNVALKAQLDRIQTNGDGFFVVRTPGWANQTVNVYSIAVDFVF